MQQFYSGMGRCALAAVAVTVGSVWLRRQVLRRFDSTGAAAGDEREVLAMCAASSVAMALALVLGWLVSYASAALPALLEPTGAS